MEKEIIKLKINREYDRDNVVVALTNNGYKTWIEMEKHNIEPTDYFVVFENK